MTIQNGGGSRRGYLLQELYVTLTRKGTSRLEQQAALRYIDHIAAWPVAISDFKSVRPTIELSISSILSFWDALIVVMALNSGARALYSEDCNRGRKFWEF